MISIEKAIELVRQNCQPIQSESVDLAYALNRVAANDVISDEDSPPFTKSLVDGYAVCSSDFDLESMQLPVSRVLTAGEMQQEPFTKGTALQIMTGAPIPAGADCVVMVEHTTPQAIDGKDYVVIQTRDVKPGQNVLPKSSVVKSGDTILKKGDTVTASLTGALAEFGKSVLELVCEPKLAVMTTGNEIVDCSQPIEHAQIRNSNGPMLSALARARACHVTDMGIVGDDQTQLSNKISQALSNDILVLSGGVSAGVLDLVPAVLQEKNVKQVFHKVALKPGKPIWFGVFEQDDHRCLVFGLPGNPVSSLACFLLFVGLAIKEITRSNQPMFSSAILGEDFQVSGNRPTYWPSHVQINEQGIAIAHPLPWKGSSDLLTASHANAMLFFPQPGVPIKQGTIMTTLWDRLPACQ